MNITLLRRGDRALILPRGKELVDCPQLVHRWLGAPYAQCLTEITADTPMPGVDSPVVLAELLQKGFCALDMHGLVRALDAPPF